MIGTYPIYALGLVVIDGSSIRLIAAAVLLAGLTQLMVVARGAVNEIIPQLSRVGLDLLRSWLVRLEQERGRRSE